MLSARVDLRARDNTEAIENSSRGRRGILSYSWVFAEVHRKKHVFRDARGRFDYRRNYRHLDCTRSIEKRLERLVHH